MKKLVITFGILLVLVACLFRVDVVEHGNNYHISDTSQQGDKAIVVECPLYDDVEPILIINI